MNAPPKVFISATSGDLGSVRQVVKEALLTIGCHPVEQTNFGPDWRTVEGMLRAKIEGCQALIHIAGMRYGAEPKPATLPTDTPRRSYTQMEYDIGCQLQEQRGEDGFRVYTFICPEDFPFDPNDAEPKKHQQLQRAHRARLIDSPRVYEPPHLIKTQQDIIARIHSLQEVAMTLRQDLTSATERVDHWGQTMNDGLQELKAGQLITADRVRLHLLESSQQRLAKDCAAADREPRSDDRQRLKDSAQAAHQSRIARIEQLATSFAIIEGRADATTEVKEMTRILAEEGVDAALGYIETQRPALLARVVVADAAHVEQRRAQLLPLLQAAGLQETQGQTVAARTSYQDLLKLDPQWPEALEDYARFLFYQSSYFETTGPLTSAVADAHQCLIHAKRYYDLGPAQPRASRAMKNAHDQMGDVLLQRGAKGDADLVLAHCQQSLTLAEALYETDPDNSETARDVSISLNKLGNILAKRGQPGDADVALKHFTRCHETLEKVLEANPDSAQAARDVSLSLDYLGNFLAQRGEPGDANVALKCLTRCLDISERLLSATPNSAQASRDVAVILDKLGDFLAQRGEPGDEVVALQNYTRGLQISEMYLAAHSESAQAARDVSISLAKLGNILAQRAQPGDAEMALKHLTRSLDLRQQLLASNPNSARAVQDLAVCHCNLAVYCEAQGDKVGEEAHDRACYDLLHERILKGVTFDPAVMRLHDKLHTRFGKK